MPRDNRPRVRRPGRLSDGELLAALKRTLADIEQGEIDFPAGGKRRAAVRIRERVARLEARGVRPAAYFRDRRYKPEPEEATP